MTMVNILKKKKNTKIGYFYCKFGAKHTPFSLNLLQRFVFKILQDDRVLKVKEGDNSE